MTVRFENLPLLRLTPTEEVLRLLYSRAGIELERGRQCRHPAHLDDSWPRCPLCDALSDAYFDVEDALIIERKSLTMEDLADLLAVPEPLAREWALLEIGRQAA